MIFSELYSVYYNAVAKILERAVKGDLTQKEYYDLIQKSAFSESALAIDSAIRQQEWQIIKKDFSTPIQHVPSMPLTFIEKRWLKAILLDERISLFDIKIPEIDNVQPLFTKQDYQIYDQYQDGDDFSDLGYRARFKLILTAIKEKRYIKITMLNRYGKKVNITLLPKGLEYSQKDNKFRLTSNENASANVNLGKIISCDFTGKISHKKSVLKERRVELVAEITNERNALERVLLHFAHFEKQVEKIDEKKYLLKLTYFQSDETELVIRMLSFGARIKVLSPSQVVKEIKNRLLNQINFINNSK